MIELSANQRDGLVEILNIANGRAAASLSKTLNEPITIRVPTLQFVPLDRAETILVNATGDDICSVSQQFTGPFDTRATLIFPRDKCATLVTLWAGEPLSAEAIADMRDDTLAEIGNIVLYAAFAAIARLLDGTFTGTLPDVKCGHPAMLLKSVPGSRQETMLLTFIDFGFAQHNFRGFLSLFLEPDGIARLIDCVDQFIGDDGSP